MIKAASVAILLSLGCTTNSDVDEAEQELSWRPAVAEIIYFNGPIQTLDPHMREARALAIAGGRILAVGIGEVLRHIGLRTRWINLHGRALMPGFIDPHTHVWFDHFLTATLDEGQRLVLENGVTTVGELFAGGGGFVEAMLEYEAQGRLKVRSSLYLSLVDACGVPVSSQAYDDGVRIVDRERRLRVPGVKLFADGGNCGLGPATTFEIPLPDGPSAGNLFFDVDELFAMTSEADARGYQVAIHAIGDRGRDVALEALERTLNGRPNTLRHRIEHTIWVRPDQIERYVRTGIVTTGIVALTCEINAGVRPRLNLMPELAYPWYQPYAEMLAAGVVLAWKGDFPGRPFDTIRELFILVTRREVAADGSICEQPAFYAATGDLTTAQGLQMMTIGGARVLGMESVVGSLEPGKFADLVVLSEDPLAIPRDDLKDLRILSTVIGGEALYCAPGEERLCR